MKEIEVNTKIGVTDPPVSVTFVRTREHAFAEEMTKRGEQTIRK